MSLVWRALKSVFTRRPEAKPRFESLSDMTEEKLEMLRERKEYGVGEQYRRVYETDGLTFSLVNYLTEKIVGRFFFEGETELVRRAEAWSNRVGLQFILKMLVKDAIIYGTGWCEMVPGEDGIDYFKIFNPSNIDFIRSEDGKVLMEGNRPVGFQITEDSRTLKWYRDRIEESNQVVYKARGEDLRDRIAWFTLERYGDSLTGISLLKPVYRSIIIRANVADLVGESAFRGGGIVAYFSGSPPQQTIDDMARDLKNITSRNVFVMSDKWRLDVIPTPDIKERIQQIIYLADEEAASLGIPLDVLMTTVKSYASDIGVKLADLEERVSSYQKYIAYQFNTQVISYLLKLWKAKGDLRIVFSPLSTGTRLQNSRIRAALARRGLLRWDPELEMRIRREEGLPTSFLEKELDRWKKEKKTVEPPVPTKDVDREEEAE